MNLPIALGYLRVSTIMQKEEGISLDTQETRIKDYCKYKQFQEPIFYKDEGISGKNMKRPQLIKLLEDIKEGTYIIVAELSRLSRNTKDALNILEQINNKKGILISLSPDIDFSSPSGKMMYTMLSAFSTFERDTISERVSVNMKNLSKQNKLRPKPPFGFKFIGKDKDMVKDQEQQVILDIIKKKYSEGNGYTKISRYLNENYFNKTLKHSENQIFYPQTIKNILADHNLINYNRKAKKINEKYLESRNKKE